MVIASADCPRDPGLRPQGGYRAFVANEATDSLRKVLTDRTSGGPTTATFAALRPRLIVTFAVTAKSQLLGGAGTDWFWFQAAATTSDKTGAEQKN